MEVVIPLTFLNQPIFTDSSTTTLRVAFIINLIWIIIISGKLPTSPSPKPTLTFTSHFGENVGLGER